MSSQESNPKEANPEIFYTRLTPSPDPSSKGSSHAPIVFLHGLSTFHMEFSHVTPFLSEDYDLILVDLPGHSGSRDILPFTLDNAVNALSHLISTKVAGGRAHIVGLSLGGVVALEFASGAGAEPVLHWMCAIERVQEMVHLAPAPDGYDRDTIGQAHYRADVLVLYRRGTVSEA
jgi:pimeloyl-ACP methyl ester carboxylesterase